MSAKKGPQGDKRDDDGDIPNAPKVTYQLPTLNLNVTRISGSTGITLMNKRFKDMHRQMTNQLDTLAEWSANPLYANYCASIKVAINKMQAENEIIIDKMFPSMELIENLKRLWPEAQKTVERLEKDKEMIKNNRKQAEEELWNKMVYPYHSLYEELTSMKEISHELLEHEDTMKFNRAAELENMRRQLDRVKREQNHLANRYEEQMKNLMETYECQDKYLKTLNAKLKEADEKLKKQAIVKQKSSTANKKKENIDEPSCPHRQLLISDSGRGCSTGSSIIVVGGKPCSMNTGFQPGMEIEIF
ncbi:hypothetical protein WDU94_004136 [Cyamophila willieti]